MTLPEIALLEPLEPLLPAPTRRERARARMESREHDPPEISAIERPIVFPDNDRPGVMLAGAVRAYVNRYGVAPGRNLTVCDFRLAGDARLFVRSRAIASHPQRHA